MWRACIIGLCALLFVSSPVLAQWPYDPYAYNPRAAYSRFYYYAPVISPQEMYSRYTVSPQRAYAPYVVPSWYVYPSPGAPFDPRRLRGYGW